MAEEIIIIGRWREKFQLLEDGGRSCNYWKMAGEVSF
jgi:hypothetical protein